METGSGRSIGISAPASASDNSSLAVRRWIEPLLAQTRGNARQELLALSQESDLELLGEGLLSFAGRQERAGREALAALIYSTLAETREVVLPTSVSERARRRFAALNGRGSLGDRAEVLARHFVQEATDPVTLIAMTVGSTAFGAARLGLLSRLAAGPAGAFTRGLGARALASGGAFAVEIPAFWAVNKGLRETIHPGSQNWDLSSNARELATLGLSLGALKLAGFGASSLQARAGLQHSWSAPLFRQSGMFGGILAGHGLERWFGLRPAGDGAATLLDSLVLLLQFNVGGRLSHQLMGSRWAGRSAELEARIQSALQRPRGLAGNGLDLQSPLAMAMAGGDGGPSRPGAALEPGRPQISLMEGAARGSTDSARVWRNLLQDVLDRGHRRELEALKNRLREALEAQSEKSYVGKQIERFRTGDPEEWKSGISRISDMLETNPAILGSVESAESLRDFAADWNSRPHFKNGSQVPIQFASGVPGGVTVNALFAELREAMAARPSLDGLRQFLTPRQGRGLVGMVLERVEAGETLVYFNARKAGVKVRFDAQGHLSGRVEVREPFNQGASAAEIEALPVSVTTTKPARRKARPAASQVVASTAAVAAPIANHGPRKGENPTEWAMRLLEASRSPDRSVAHDIILEMERRLTDPASADLARQTIERWVSLTNIGSNSRSEGIVARQYRLHPLRNPITIVGLPTTFMPDSWSQVFAEGLVAARGNGTGRPTNRAIELGSGTGWASIVLAKLGMAREILAFDKNPQAPALGRLNAALNGVANIRFETSNLMDNLPPELRADLIIACLPQVKRNGAIQDLRDIADYYAGGESYFDSYGLGLIERALGQARERLEPSGRVLFNLGGRPSRPVLEDLFASQAFRPRIRFSRMIPQDAGTDISGLAAQERASGIRFEFFRPENAAEPISANEALAVQNPHHMLYFMEGRPYSDLLRQALNARLEEGGRLGYTRQAGAENSALREGLARELSRDWGFRVTPEVLHLGPSSDTILEGLLRVLPTEKGSVLFAGLGADTFPAPLQPYAPSSVAPRFADIQAALETSSPSVLVLQLPRETWLDRAGLNSLLQTTGQRRIPTIVLEDQPLRMPKGPHPLLEAMSASVPAVELTHVIHSLDRRYGVPALPLAALVSANSMLHLSMDRYADLSHSRASSLTQDAYARYFERAGESDSAQAELPGVLDSVLTDFSPSPRVAKALDSKPAFESSPRGEHPDPISMSFGESEWRAPIRFGDQLWDAAQRPRAELEAEARQAVVEYLFQSRGVRVNAEQILLGAGVHPLLASALRGLRDLGGGYVQVAVPRPSYGMFYPTVELSGAKLLEYPTRASGRFLTEDGLIGREVLNGGPRLSAVLINEPSNPAGQFHSPESLQALARQIQSAKGYLLFDDVYGMLDLGRSRQRRLPSMQILQQALGPRLVSFGGVSKEFASGGLRFGFAVVADPNLARAMQRYPAPAPDPLAMNIGPNLLRHWERLIQEHRTYLSSRAYRLEQVFRERQLPVLEVQGGYSALVNLEFLYGRRVRLRQGGEATIDSSNLQDLLYSEAGLKVYSDQWARQPGHYRLVFSIERLDEAAERLKKFFRSAR